jgi:hypothetical protein
MPPVWILQNSLPQKLAAAASGRGQPGQLRVIIMFVSIAAGGLRHWVIITLQDSKYAEALNPWCLHLQLHKESLDPFSDIPSWDLEHQMQAVGHWFASGSYGAQQPWLAAGNHAIFIKARFRLPPGYHITKHYIHQKTLHSGEREIVAGNQTWLAGCTCLQLFPALVAACCNNQMIPWL